MSMLEDVEDHLDWIDATLRMRNVKSAEDTSTLFARIQSARTRIDAHENLTPDRWDARLGLLTAEAHVVWLLAAIALSPQIRQAMRAAEQLDTWDPPLDAIRRVIYGVAPSAQALRDLGPEGRLRKLGLIERSDGGGGDVHESRWTWAISRRVLALLHGDLALDTALAAILRVPGDVAPLGELAVRADVATTAYEAMATARAVVVATGTPGLGKRTLLLAAAREAGLDVLEISVPKLAKDPRKQLRAIARECKLLARVPLLLNLSAEHVDAIGEELIAQVDGLVLATTGPERPPLRWERPVIVVELGQPTGTQRAQLWRRALGAGTASDAEMLAERYPLAPGLVFRAAEAAKARAAQRAITPEDIYAGIRAVLDDQLGQLARRVTVTQTWDDLVLPAEQIDPILELLARVRKRQQVYEQWGFAAKVGKGLGVTALFSGEPGTGKSMVAALIAKDLGLEIYQVDLGKLVSKYIGETEKQLGVLFDAAEAGHAILLFDEADSLFGKRTDVKTSNDRYANLETNYLLQRLETFTGICLLTSNHEINIDPAFQRRLSLHVRFEVPDEAERIKLWRAVLPAAAPIAGVDFARLAKRYEMSGGYIRNAALRAAFLAADENSPITAQHLDRAAKTEYEGMGKLAS
jgi:hypothetical protein